MVNRQLPTLLENNRDASGRQVEPFTPPPPLPSPIHNDALRGKKSYKITALCYQISSGIEVTG